VKVSHLTYIGAGTVSCNYDGVFKHHAVIGEDMFIGSNTMLVAPVTIGDCALTGSGPTITRDVLAEAPAVVRAHQQIKPGLAKRLFEKLRAKKAGVPKKD
jgi:bifunctional UDP-N-acetylglucosamine pyrophosphorylase/glucosamine-1-phosphate N-acetyltransferase